MHVQRREERSYYALDRLYRDCPTVEVEGVEQADRGVWSSDADVTELDATTPVDNTLSAQSVEDLPLAGPAPDEDGPLRGTDSTVHPGKPTDLSQGESGGTAGSGASGGRLPERRLILIRHGQTEFNLTGRMQGQMDTPLSENGLAEARSAAVELGVLADRDDHQFRSGACHGHRRGAG